MGTQSGAILELPPTEKAREAVREAFDGTREIGTEVTNLEETATLMAARMIDSARNAALDAVSEALADQPKATTDGVRVFVLGTLFGAALVLVAFLVALLALHLGR